MNRIELKINDDKSMEVLTPQPLVEGENLTTEISVEIPASWAGSAIRALITTPLGKLVDAVDASVPVGLTNTMLDGKGTLYVEYVAMKDGTEIARTKSPALLPVSAARSMTGDVDPAPLPDLVAEMVQAKNDANTAAQTANDAAASANEETAKWVGATAQANTLEPDELATASITEGEDGKIFNFGVPQGIPGIKGDKGDKGDTGATGATGAQGIQGAPGEVTTAQLNTALALKADKAQEAWIIPTLLNNWVNVAGQTTRYKKDKTGVVYVELFLVGGTTFSSFFTLPAGYRPGQVMLMPSLIGSGPGTIFIDASGNVQNFSGTATSNQRFIGCFRAAEV